MRVSGTQHLAPARPRGVAGKSLSSHEGGNRAFFLFPLALTEDLASVRESQPVLRHEVAVAAVVARPALHADALHVGAALVDSDERALLYHPRPGGRRARRGEHYMPYTRGVCRLGAMPQKAKSGLGHDQSRREKHLCFGRLSANLPEQSPYQSPADIPAGPTDSATAPHELRFLSYINARPRVRYTWRAERPPPAQEDCLLSTSASPAAPCWLPRSGWGAWTAGRGPRSSAAPRSTCRGCIRRCPSRRSHPSSSSRRSRGRSATCSSFLVQASQRTTRGASRPRDLWKATSSRFPISCRPRDPGRGPLQPVLGESSESGGAWCPTRAHANVSHLRIRPMRTSTSFRAMRVRGRDPAVTPAGKTELPSARRAT